MSSLKRIDKIKLEKLFGMNTGYVCDFWDSTFGEFVKESTGVDVYTEEYAQGGTSKANRLRTFWKKESDELTAKLIEALLEYWRTLQLVSGEDVQLSDRNLYHEGLKIVESLKPVNNNGKNISTENNIIKKKENGNKIFWDKLTNNQTFAIIIGGLVLLFIIYLIFKYSGVNLTQFR